MCSVGEQSARGQKIGLPRRPLYCCMKSLASPFRIVLLSALEIGQMCFNADTSRRAFLYHCADKPDLFYSGMKIACKYIQEEIFGPLPLISLQRELNIIKIAGQVGAILKEYNHLPVNLFIINLLLYREPGKEAGMKKNFRSRFMPGKKIA